MDHELDSREVGRAARKAVPRSSLGDWVPSTHRPDPVALLEEQNRTRVDWLVPIRHGRMRSSPFAFYRGAARVMASDLTSTPVTGLTVQLVGDAHLANFGAYASPERHLVFDANDFDETLRGPWEWDLERLAASFFIAGRHVAMSKAVCRDVTREVVRAYREGMAGFAGRGILDVWYEHVRVEDLRATASDDVARRIDRFIRRSQSKTSLQALDKLTVEVAGQRCIRSDPPVLFRLRDLAGELRPDELEEAMVEALDTYKSSLSDDRRWLLDRYRPVDFGLKVVGVGSVGTRCLIALMEDRSTGAPLFLQAKEATASVLEEHLDPSPYDNHGRRVVEGQRLVQAESDIFLGWTAGREGRHFYLRQLRDWKGSVDLDAATPELLRGYARLCGLTLARGHARSGDRVAIAAYVGRSGRLDDALVAFAEAYAAQNRDDHRAFCAAIDDGRLPVGEG